MVQISANKLGGYITETDVMAFFPIKIGKLKEFIAKLLYFE